MSITKPRKDPYEHIHYDLFNKAIKAKIGDIFLYTPDYLYYPEHLKYWGFSDYAIETALEILSPKTPDKPYSFFSETKFLTASDAQSGLNKISEYFMNEALKLVIIENRANDPYAILELILRAYTRHFEVIQLQSQEQQIDYLKNWQKEYSKILGKNRIIDSLEKRFLYMKLPQFKIEELSKEKYQEKILLEGKKRESTVIDSTDPYYHSSPIIYCTEDCILYTHPYFKDKIKNYRIILPAKTLIERYPNIVTDWVSKYHYKKLDFTKPEDLEKYKNMYMVKFMNNDSKSDQEYNMKYGYRKEHKSSFAYPNNFFGNITIDYDKDDVGTINGKISFDYDIDEI